MSCITTGNHCWHSTVNGVWSSITPPPMVCCHCGCTPQSLHGPYAPTIGEAKPTISVNKAKLLFDSKAPTDGGLNSERHGPYTPGKNLLNG